MSSTTVAQHTTQPLNFGPEWLRALSTPESTTPISSTSGTGGSGNVFKFSATKYRYSKNEILALRSNVTERLAEDIKNEIMENLKDVESIFRPNILEPLTLTTPTADENAKMSSLSSYLSGRTPGGGGRGGSNTQQSSQHDLRPNRGGSISNGRGGSRGRGGRDNTFGSNRGNNNSEDIGENGGGGAGDDTSGPSSSSWSRGSYHSRGGGGSFGNRVRSYDDREQSQPFRRGGSARPGSDGWRRSRGDDEENNDTNEDGLTPPNTSSSWTSRGGQTRRGGGGGGNGSMEHRTKSNEKWTYNDDRRGQSSSSYESNQQRGWRTNATMSDRDLNARRPQTKRERMPEWMDDNNDGDDPLSNPPFEQDEIFAGTSSSTLRQNSNEQPKIQSQTSVDETSSFRTHTSSTKSQQEENKLLEKPTPPQTDTAVVNIPTTTASATRVPESTPPVQQTLSSWDDEFEPSDVATTVVESTLAEDHEYSPPISTHPTPQPMTLESTSSSNIPIIPQQQRTQSSVIIDDKQWFYKDPQNTVQGPFSSADMERWFAAGYFTVLLPVKRSGETQFSTIQQLTKELGRLPFRTDVPSIPQPVVSESKKFNPMTYTTSTSTSAANNAYFNDFLTQQQQQPPRQNVQQSMLFNRQSSIPLSTTDRKPVTSPSLINPQLQAYFTSQQHQQQHSQSSSSLFSSNLVSDPAIVYQQHQPQLQRSISATNQQQAQQPLFDDIQHSFRHISAQPNTTSFFGTNLSSSQTSLPSSSQQPDDIMTRLAQAMQNHGQQQEKVEEQRRLEQQRRELELERIKLAQQAEQLRLQREEDERRQIELQQQRLEDELRKKKEATVNKPTIFDQMKDMAKTMDQKKQQQQQQQQPIQQQQPVKPQPKSEIDPFIAFQQSLQFQKEQQAKIDAQKAENVRRYQQQQQQQQQQPQQQHQQQAAPQQTFKLPETAGWARHPSQTNEQTQALNFAEIQKQEQEQERRAREAALAAQQLAKSEALNIPNSSTSSSSNTTKPSSWARTLFAGNSSTASGTNPNLSSDHDTHDISLPESPITSYNQQATNAPKPRSATNQQSTPWNTTTSAPNTSLQDIQRQQQQQTQTEVKQPQQQPQQQQTHSASSGHSTPAWGGIFQHSTSTPMFWGNESSASKPTPTNSNKSSTPWTELKSSTTVPPSTSKNVDLTKSEREAKCLFTTTRTQDALSKWIQTQFKDNLQAIDVPTLVQLLKDIDNAEDIIEYVQPYIGSVSKAKEFANDFISKRKQLANAEPELDNERLNELAMAPTSSNRQTSNSNDEGFQLASSNGQKKKAKKMKGQKIDVKQLGFMVNNRPEQRDDIDKVQM